MYQVHVNINRRHDLLCMTLSFHGLTKNIDLAVRRVMTKLGYDLGDYEYEFQIMPDDLK